MPVRLIFAVLLAALLSGCVAAYDPDTGGASRLSVETRAAESGKARTAPPREGLRIFRRASAPVAKVPDPESTSNRFAPPSDAISIPDTPAGRQLYWLLGQLNGGNSRQIDFHFSKPFLARTPVSQIRTAIIQWRRDEFADSPADVFKIDSSTEKQISIIVQGRATGRFSRIQLGTDPAGLIGFLTLTALPEFNPGEFSEWAKLDSKFTALPGHASLAAYELTDSALKPIHAFEPTRIYSIDSIADLYIAGALAEQVKAGALKWDEPLAIHDDLKSLMGGHMQLEPPETEFPISRFLEVLLGAGDTTAFDHLLARVGRDHVEAYMSRYCSDPSRNKPFLATIEYFRIKLGSNRALPKKFAAADTAGRQQILTVGGEADKSIPSLAAAANWRLPYEIEHIGWFASPQDCCRLIADLHVKSRQQGMEPLARALSMSEGLAFDPAIWKSASFKSGSEPGVLAMLWLLERNDGKRFTLSIIANDPKQPIDLARLNTYAAAAIKLLGEEGKKKQP